MSHTQVSNYTKLKTFCFMSTVDTNCRQPKFLQICLILRCTNWHLHKCHLWLYTLKFTTHPVLIMSHIIAWHLDPKIVCEFMLYVSADNMTNSLPKWSTVTFLHSNTWVYSSGETASSKKQLIDTNIFPINVFSELLAFATDLSHRISNKRYPTKTKDCWGFKRAFLVQSIQNDE